MRTSKSETKCRDVGLHREEHNQESNGVISRRPNEKKIWTVSLWANLNGVAKGDDKSEILLKGKENFFDQADHEAWRRGRTAILWRRNKY